MAKLKEVPNAEVHWQVAGWNIKDQANFRIKQLLDPADVSCFAPIYVNPSSYYWSAKDVSGWKPLSSATDQEKETARAALQRMKDNALRRNPSQGSLIDKVFTYPNDDFVLLRYNDGGKMELMVTGWGFANLNRTRGGVITDIVDRKEINEITLSFIIDGQAVPNRDFEYLQGMNFVPAVTDAQGIYNFGRIKEGTTVNVRDVNTGTQSITTVTPEVKHIDVDVTQFIEVRVIARKDDQPISDDSAELVYGRREARVPINQGIGKVQLPYYEGEQCKVTFRGESQQHELRLDAPNEFVFELYTPKVDRTDVVVNVSGDGAPIVNERVILQTPLGAVSLTTDANGQARHSFDTPATGGNIQANVRDKSDTKPAQAGTVVMDFEFNTPPVIEFEASVLVVNTDGDSIPQYPVTIDLGDGSQPMSYLTDAEGRIGRFTVVGGNTLTCWDGNNSIYTESFTLDPLQSEYVFRLPFDNSDSLFDMTLRVIQRNKVPAVGATCILTQDNVRILATLNDRGEMYFDHDDFRLDMPVEVDLYHPQRQFPHLNFTLENDEYEYELREEDGPQPWWKIAGEIALALGGVVALYYAYFGLERAFIALNNIIMH